MAPSSRPPGFEPLLVVIATVLAFVARGALPLAESAAGAPTRVLRVAADPNNLPFTNERLEGFENRIAELIARDLHAKIEYVWRPQGRGFFRQSFKEDSCDLVLGVPAGFERVLTTRPYYRSSYVFVTRRDRRLNLRSLDDPRLRYMKIGVPLVGDDGANPPPAHALARLGLVDQVRGYPVHGDSRDANPPARILDAVADGDIDVAVVWGPLAGWFAERESNALEVTMVPAPTGESLPFTYAIAVGVRRGETGLRDEVETVLARRQAEIDEILDSYGVPRVPEAAAARVTP